MRLYFDLYIFSPKPEQKQEVAHSIVEAFPNLKTRSGSGYVSLHGNLCSHLIHLFPVTCPHYNIELLGGQTANDLCRWIIKA